jgi:ABC-type glycerol-3-phosphate transport system permease component
LPDSKTTNISPKTNLDSEQKSAASIDGANPRQLFFHIIVPHLQRAIGVVLPDAQNAIKIATQKQLVQGLTFGAVK